MSANPKEPSYFAFPEGSVSDPLPHPDTYIRTWDGYKDLFSNVSGKRVVGESSTLYFQVPEAPERIREKLGNLKMLVLLRNPPERAFSHYLLHRSTNDEPAETFRAAMDAWPLRAEQGWRVHWDYVTPGFYARHLLNYYRVFPRENIKVALFDRLRTEPKVLMAEIADFLEVDRAYPFDTSDIHNASRIPRAGLVSGAVAGFMRDFASRTQIMPRFLRKPITSGLKSIVLDRPVISATDRRRLIDVYRDDTTRLEQIIDVKLTSWYAPDGVPGAATMMSPRLAASATSQQI